MMLFSMRRSSEPDASTEVRGWSEAAHQGTPSRGGGAFGDRYRELTRRSGAEGYAEVAGAAVDGGKVDAVAVGLNGRSFDIAYPFLRGGQDGCHYFGGVGRGAPVGGLLLHHEPVAQAVDLAAAGVDEGKGAEGVGGEGDVARRTVFDGGEP